MSNSLSQVHPELISEWSDKNFPLTPDNVSYGSNKIVWWKGLCNHEWEASVKCRSNGEKCPICSGKRVAEGINDLASQKPNLVLEWSDKNEIEPNMVTLGSNKKVWWKCKSEHEWQATVKNRVNGSGCPYCSHNIVLKGFNDLSTMFPKVAREWSKKNYPLKPTMVTPFANKKVWLKCRKGHEWESLISTRSYGSKCPYCSGYIFKKGINDFATTQPELAEEWSERNRMITPDTINDKSRKNVWWKCKTCDHEWQAVVNSRVKGLTCPVCAERLVQTGKNDLASTDAHILTEWDFESNKTILPTTISRKSLKKVWWKCSCGHSWKARIYERTIEGKSCTVCESDYRKVFPQLVVGFYAQMKGLGVQINNQEVIGLPIETYMPDEKLAIESVSQSEDIEIVKRHLCEARNIMLIKLPYRNSESETEYAMRLKQVFRKVHIFITSDVEEDVAYIRQRFFEWRRTQNGGTV